MPLDKLHERVGVSSTEEEAHEEFCKSRCRVAAFGGPCPHGEAVVPFVPFASSVALEALSPVWLASGVVVEVFDCGSVAVDPPLAPLSRSPSNF